MEEHSHTGYCKECKVSLESNGSLEEHQRSRKHINRLLQLGIEIPLSSVNQTEEEQLPEDSKIAYCITCEISIGNSLQAAAHYRSREHFNRRLQRGLPVTSVEPTEPEPSVNRDYINECLRHGITLSQPNVSRPPHPSASQIQSAANGPRGVNGKRKLPPGCPPIYSPTSSSVPGKSTPQFTNFAYEKRQCRPVAPIQSQEPNFTMNSFAGQHISSFTNQVLPGSGTYSAVAAAGNSYQVHTPRLPPVSTYGSHYQDTQQVEHSWNSYNGNYKDVALGIGLSERWHCDVCHRDLPDKAALQLHCDSPASCPQLSFNSLTIFQSS